MRTLEIRLHLRLSKHDGRCVSVPIVVNGRHVRIPRQRAFALAAMFGTGDITVAGEDALDAVTILREPFPRWMFCVGRHLQLTQSVMPSTWYPRVVRGPCHTGCPLEYVYYVFELILPYGYGAPYGRVVLTKNFLSNPELPDFGSHIAEGAQDRIAYFIHTLHARREELRRWMLLHARQLVGILEDVKRAYDSFSFHCMWFSVPTLPVRREYRAFVAQTLGEWYTVGGSELIAALRNQGGSPFILDAGLPADAETQPGECR